MMSYKQHKLGYVIVAVALWLLFARPAAAGNLLAGKTVWVVDVNSNEYYTSYVPLALVNALPQYAPGVIVHHIKTNEKGNPFFLLKPEDYPDAVIAGLGMCEASTKNIANYASEARKKGIPAVMLSFTEVHDLLVKWNQAYRNPVDLSLEIGDIPQSLAEATPLVQGIMPGIIENLKH